MIILKSSTLEFFCGIIRKTNAYTVQKIEECTHEKKKKG